MLVDVNPSEDRAEGLPAVEGSKQPHSAEVDGVGVGWVDRDEQVVPALRLAGCAGRIELRPRSRGISRLEDANQSAGLKVRDRRHQRRGLRRRDRDVDPPDIRGGETGSQRRPGRATVGTAKDALGPNRHVDDRRVRRVEHHIGGNAGPELRPDGAAVYRLPEAVVAGNEQRRRGDVPCGVGCDENPRDATADERARAEPRPARTTVGRTQHAASIVAVPGEMLLAGRGVDDLRVHRIDGDGTHRERTLFVRERHPRHPGVDGLPDATLRAPEVHDAGVRRIDRDS